MQSAISPAGGVPTIPPGSEQPRPAWPPALIDWGPVVFVAAVSQTALGLEQPWAGSDLELALVGLATALPLGWRRTRPVIAAGAVGAALAAQVLLGGSLHFGSFCAVLFGMYAAGRYADARRTTAAAALLLAAGVGLASATGLSGRPADVVFPLFYLTGSWAVGRAMRTLHHRADSLHRLSQALARESENEARLAVAVDRMRMARELHDVVAHTVMLMVVQAEAAEESLDSDPESTRRGLQTVQDAGRRGMDDLRNLVGVLRDGENNAEAMSPVPDLRIETLQRLFGDCGLDVRLHQSGSGDIDALPAGLQTSLYRVVQEALTNVLKHSHASSAEVDMTLDPGRLVLTVSDPGPARERSRSSGGHGLAGMRERVTLHHGTLSAGPLGGGFRVSVEVPFRQGTQ